MIKRDIIDLSSITDCSNVTVITTNIDVCNILERADKINEINRFKSLLLTQTPITENLFTYVLRTCDPDLLMTELFFECSVSATIFNSFTIDVSKLNITTLTNYTMRRGNDWYYMLLDRTDNNKVLSVVYENIDAYEKTSSFNYEMYNLILNEIEKGRRISLIEYSTFERRAFSQPFEIKSACMFGKNIVCCDSKNLLTTLFNLDTQIEEENKKLILLNVFDTPSRSKTHSEYCMHFNLVPLEMAINNFTRVKVKKLSYEINQSFLVMGKDKNKNVEILKFFLSSFDRGQLFTGTFIHEYKNMLKRYEDLDNTMTNNKEEIELQLRELFKEERNRKRRELIMELEQVMRDIKACEPRLQKRELEMNELQFKISNGKLPLPIINVNEKLLNINRIDGSRLVVTDKNRQTFFIPIDLFLKSEDGKLYFEIGEENEFLC